MNWREIKYIAKAILAARRIQFFLWGESNGAWGFEEWRRMFIKRYIKIVEIDVDNPHAIVELKKRLLQNAALSIALLAILDSMKITNENLTSIPSNLPQYGRVK